MSFRQAYTFCENRANFPELFQTGRQHPMATGMRQHCLEVPYLDSNVRHNTYLVPLYRLTVPNDATLIDCLVADDVMGRGRPGPMFSYPVNVLNVGIYTTPLSVLDYTFLEDRSYRIQGVARVNVFGDPGAFSRMSVQVSGIGHLWEIGFHKATVGEHWAPWDVQFSGSFERKYAEDGFHLSLELAIGRFCQFIELSYTIT